MTPTRSGSNYRIQTNESGPGNSSHQSKRQTFQPRGEAKMEDSRSSIGTMNSYLQVKKFLEQEKTKYLMKGWKTMSFKGQFQKRKAWLKNQRIMSEAPNKELAQKKDNSPVEAPQASTSNNLPQQLPNKDKQTQKRNQKGNQKTK
ncbi:hypothetical protein O181_087184 [Austropuccinia psidii MF-1]|uniref:Uncharacterized protein n=1 Tax=Austropuccinia psidii MF-1 TaxID=1389203 RepID=A0A9Q3IP89_9BASI|nr:hypothetical protein [Austropuccinia psidii MF-1]